MVQIIAALAAAAAPAAGAQTASPPRPVGNPGGWVAVSDYPEQALAAHQQGTVGFSLAVDAEGNVAGCRIVSSSGAASLDEATCKLMRMRAHFEPARDAGGHAVAGAFASRVRWEFPRIKQPAAPEPIKLSDSMRSRTGAATLYVDSNGFIQKCTAKDPGYWNVLPPPDICEAYPIGARYGPPTTFHGKPIGRKVTITVTIDDINVK